MDEHFSAFAKGQRNDPDTLAPSTSTDALQKPSPEVLAALDERTSRPVSDKFAGPIAQTVINPATGKPLQKEAAPLKAVNFLVRGANDQPEIPADWSRIDPALAKRVVDYLESGITFLHTNATMGDILEPERGEVVPEGATTDGTWYWGNWISYYVRTYGISPGDEFLNYLEQRNYVMPRVSKARAQEALDYYLRPT